MVTDITNKVFDDNPGAFNDNMPALPEISSSIPLVGRCPSPIMSMIDADAASFLVSLRSDLTPNPSENEPLNDSEWDKENVAPSTDLRSYHLSSQPNNIPNTTPIAVRKYTYPPPPTIKFRLTGTPSPVIQANFPHIKACDMFSPSYGFGTSEEDNDFTPSSGISLDALPLCDSIPSIKWTPTCEHQVHQNVTMSTIKPSPFVTRMNKSSDTLFTPLPCTETHTIACHPRILIETSGMLNGDNSKYLNQLSSYSPTKASESTLTV